LSNITVLCCCEPAGDKPRDGVLLAMLEACADLPVHEVGPRPGKEIDDLLTEQVVVIGEDADLAAVVLRLLRRGALRSVIVAYAAVRATAVTEIWSLPAGPAAIGLARKGEVDAVPLIRDDAGGVLVGVAQLTPVQGTVYVDENRVLSGSAQSVLVEPDPSGRVAVTIAKRRFLGTVGRRPVTVVGRAVEFGLGPGTAIIRDGVPYPRPMKRWVYYRHTEPLRLVRGVY
jgi:hypothetical protein